MVEVGTVAAAAGLVAGGGDWTRDIGGGEAGREIAAPLGCVAGVRTGAGGGTGRAPWVAWFVCCAVGVVVD